MKKILLVRHGETIWHAENRYAGRTDIALTPLGEAQAQHLALWAASAKLNAVWSSPLARAKQTATAAAIAAHLPLQIDPRLVELDFGQGEGLTSTEMKTQFPRERAAFEQDPATNFLPGGEDPKLATDRGMSALASIADGLPENGRALVVA
ncbi:MAG: histidine phosphatase family protein, partial [Granulicella sp.]